jgi:hypothetical protein
MFLRIVVACVFAVLPGRSRRPESRVGITHADLMLAASSRSCNPKLEMGGYARLIVQTVSFLWLYEVADGFRSGVESCSLCLQILRALLSPGL